MSKHTLRKDKTCLNCNYVVEKKFCSNCGQENTDTRKSFHELFIHFFEDLTHYENSFWRTIKNLLFRPASLTKEYLSGKRMSYLAPIRLYIFISFVTFFLLSVIPDSNQDSAGKTIKENVKKKDTAKIINVKSEEELKLIELEKKGFITKTYSDSLRKYISERKKEKVEEKGSLFIFGKKYKSVEELDSIQANCKPADKLNFAEYWFSKKIQTVQDNNTNDELREKFVETYMHNLPKSLFFYMPLFAFVLWIFQNKKRWYYFDHGIFTLHYFSFLLLGLLIIKTEKFLLSFLNDYFIFRLLDGIFITVAILYMLYYFFPAHHRFYQEKRSISIIKGIVMFFINIFFLAIILTFFAIYSFINIH